MDDARVLEFVEFSSELIIISPFGPRFRKLLQIEMILGWRRRGGSSVDGMFKGVCTVDGRKIGRRMISDTLTRTDSSYQALIQAT